MPARLIASDGGPDIRVDGALVVGRDPQCGARIDSQSISRRHCFLIEVNGEVWVRDLDSTNGTWINSQRVRTGWLRPGDVLDIAYFRFLVDDDPAERASRAEAPNRLAPDCSVLAGPTGAGLPDESQAGISRVSTASSTNAER